MMDDPLPSAPCVECGEPAGFPPIHDGCLKRMLSRLADLQTAVIIAREERDRAEQEAKARVQIEMAALRRRIVLLKRPAED